jgi:hypothetical protein
VWKALAGGDQVKFVAPLSAQQLTCAFADEFGSRVAIRERDGGFDIIGRGWEGYAKDGEMFLYLNCDWDLARDDEWLTQIVRAGLRARCTVFDPQSGCWWDAPLEPGWDPDGFDLWEQCEHLDA